MKLRNCSIEEFAKRTNEKKIACFGAYVMPYSLCNEYEEFHFEDRIVLFADNDKKKQGKQFDLNGKKIEIVSADEFAKRITQDMVILITSDYFAAIIEQLDAYTELNNAECYIYPFMKYDIEQRQKIQVKHTKEPQIPKVIHYFWFGENKKSELEEYCIASWKKYCPGYEIIEWNESNYDITKNRFMKEAYAEKKYGFVPDYARLDIINQYGGLYFDTDVELIKNIDELLYNEAFFAMGFYGRVSSGLGFGSKKGHPVLKRLLEEYETFSFYHEDGSLNLTTNTMHEEPVFRSFGIRQKNILQRVDNLTVLPYDFMAPIVPGFVKYKVSCNTVSIHHNRLSWGSAQQHRELEKSFAEYDKICQRFLQE